MFVQPAGVPIVALGGVTTTTAIITSCATGPAGTSSTSAVDTVMRVKRDEGWDRTVYRI